MATKAEPKKFTAAQLRAWKAYEKVRKQGRWNMFDSNARRATGLSGEMYSFVMQNYVALKEAVESKSA